MIELALYTYLFWLGYLAVCGIYVGWRKAPIWVQVLLAPVVLSVLGVDVLFNYTLASVLFFQLPPRGCYTMTERISTYKDGDQYSWRGKFGKFICANMLDPFQQGGHCK